jgi:uncharacterized RDD family membrane protein YckC
LALAIDMLWQIGTLMLISWALFAAATHAPDRARASVTISGSVAIAIVVAVLFLVFFGYFIAFEAFWNGQTPGKKLLGIRVVRDGGYPLDLAGSFVRNLIRIGELGLGFYAVSAVVTLLSPENKRLGDLAAGTIVVRDARAQSLAAIRQNAAEDTLRIALLNGDEHALVARFIARRADMAPQHRRALAAQIAERVRSRVSSDLQRLDDEELLERING